MFKNCTEHTIVVRGDDGDTAFMPSGHIARVGMTQIESGVVQGVPVVKNVYGAVEGMPDKEVGTVYIVSAMVMANTSRRDCVSPDTGPTAFRNAAGQVEAVARFVERD